MTISLHTKLTVDGIVLSDFEDGPELYRIEHKPDPTLPYGAGTLRPWRVAVTPFAAEIIATVVTPIRFASTAAAEWWCLYHRTDYLAVIGEDQPTADREEVISG